MKYVHLQVPVAVTLPLRLQRLALPDVRPVVLMRVAPEVGLADVIPSLKHLHIRS